MRPLLAALLLAAPVAAVPAAGQAAGIARIPSPAPGSPILAGVVVPPGSTIVILSGMLASPIDPAKKMPDIKAIADLGDTRTQTISIFTKMKALLAAQGYALSDVVKLTAFVAGDPQLGGKMDFDGFNAGYKTFFGTADNPNLVARSTVQVAALAGPYFLIEIEATVAKAPAAK